MCAFLSEKVYSLPQIPEGMRFKRSKNKMKQEARIPSRARTSSAHRIICGLFEGSAK